MGKGRRRTRMPEMAGPDDALALFDKRFEAGDLDAALCVADEAARRFPASAAIHHARGLALWGLHRSQAAADALRRAVELDPAAPDPQLDLASLLVDDLGAPHDALAVLRAGRRALRDPSVAAAAHAIRGRAWIALEDPRTAEKEFHRACRLRPEDADLAVQLAEARLEALDLAGAEEALAAALALDPATPQAHWLRAVILDRRGESRAAEEAFGAAARADPEGYFQPERLAEEEFDRQVERALREVPPRFRRYLDNTEIAVEPYPDDRFLRHENLSPLVLGVFVGTPLTERTFEQADLPPRIVIFQRNLENVCRTRRELVREIGITVRHEIAHLLGMEEDAIEEAGHG